jgi:hypothetical protein
MKKKLVVFGTNNYSNSIQSLIKSSKNYFTEHIVFKPENIDFDFYHKNIKILSQPKGAGYWLWKPYVIKKVLEQSNDGDLVFYVDAGNIFLEDPKTIYTKFNQERSMIFFDNRDGISDENPLPNKNWTNKTWTKKDAFVLMNLDNEKTINDPHVNASYQIYIKNKNSLNFINELLFWSENENILTDVPNLYGDNYSSFISHRHDQSVLSLMCSKYNLYLEIDPSEWGNKCDKREFPQLFFHHRNPNFIL